MRAEAVGAAGAGRRPGGLRWRTSRSTDADVRAAMTGAGLADPYRVRLSEQAPSLATASGANQMVRLFYRDGVLQAGHAGQRSRRRRAGCGCRSSSPPSWGPSPATRSSSPAPCPAARRCGSSGSTATCSRSASGRTGARTARLFLNPSYGNDSNPPPLVIASDSETFDALRTGYDGSSTDTWVSPVDTRDLTLSGGRRVAEAQAAAYRAAGLEPSTDFAVRNSGTGQMPEFVARTTSIRDGLRGPVLPIALGGSLLALLLVGAAGSYWADRRAREVRLLSSRGVGPGALAAKAALELALPAVAGTVLGWLLARWLVAGLGPSPVLDRSAPVQAALTAGIALLAGVAPARAGRRPAQPGRHRAAGRRPAVPARPAAVGAAAARGGAGLLAAAALRCRRDPGRRASRRSTCWWSRSRCCS